jgi:hypothetical protein
VARRKGHSRSFFDHLPPFSLSPSSCLVPGFRGPVRHHIGTGQGVGGCRLPDSDCARLAGVGQSACTLHYLGAAACCRLSCCKFSSLYRRNEAPVAAASIYKNQMPIPTIITGFTTPDTIYTLISRALSNRTEKRKGKRQTERSLGRPRSPIDGAAPHRGSGTRRLASRGVSSSSSPTACIWARSGSAKCSRRRLSAWRLTYITHRNVSNTARLDASSAQKTRGVSLPRQRSSLQHA